MTTEDFLRPTRSCAEEQKPLKLVVFACRSFPMRQEEVNPVSPVSTQLSETNSTLRSLAPVALLACLKGMYCSGRLSAGVLASLALQFLPILAQRVSRKQEKINRKGAKFRKGPVLQLLRSLCQQLEAIPGSHHACESLHGYVSGTDMGHLGDGLAELLRCLAACKSRTRLATALVAVADEVLRVLPFLFPGTFGSASSKPCAAWAAALVGAPVHGGFTCAACHLTPIVGPRFESLAPGRSQSLCGECFTKDSLQGRAEEHDFSCRLAPEDYDAAAALDDSLCDGGMDAHMGFNSQTSGIFHTGPLLAEAFSPWPIGPAVQVAQMLSSAATFTSTPAAGLSALYGVVHNVGQSGMDRLLSQDSENGLSRF